MLEHTAGYEPIRIGGIRRFRRRLVGQGENPRLAVREAIKSNALAGLYIGVEAFAVPPARFLSIDDGPTQPANLVV